MESATACANSGDTTACDEACSEALAEYQAAGLC
jgi:hypothetical protein